MKKILRLGVILSFLLVNHTFAAYAFNATTSGSTINATLNGVPRDSTSSFQLVAQTTPFSATSTPPLANPSLSTGTDPSIQKVSNQSVVTWSLPENSNTTYYLQVAEIAPLKLPVYITASTSVKTAQATLYFSHLTTSLEGSSVKIEGRIDPVKQPNYAQYSETLVYSTNKDLSNPINTPIPSVQDASNPGSYYWLIPTASNTTYYAQQTITLNSNNVTIDPTIINFDGATGSAFSGSDDAIGPKILNTQSYTLLSGFPGFSVLPDPTLCARERADTTKPAPAFCDLNDVLNYFMKLLIGLSGVVLVVRIIYEGFVILTSDLPFKVASAKSALFTALLGLLLALSAYLILNTINPKLVDENIGLQQLSITVDGDTNTPTTFVSNGQLPGGAICPGSGRSGEVAAVAQSFIGKVTYKYGAKSAGAQSDGTAALDCSAFANTVLKCSGFNAPADYTNSGSGDIFSKGQPVNMSTGFKVSGNGDVLINNIKLNPGDLVGWTQATSTYGHVILYVGNGQFMDSHGGGASGKAIGSYTAAQIQKLYSSQITAVKRIPL